MPNNHYHFIDNMNSSQGFLEDLIQKAIQLKVSGKNKQFLFIKKDAVELFQRKGDKEGPEILRKIREANKNAQPIFVESFPDDDEVDSIKTPTFQNNIKKLFYVPPIAVIVLTILFFSSEAAMTAVPVLIILGLISIAFIRFSNLNFFQSSDNRLAEFLKGRVLVAVFGMCLSFILLQVHILNISTIITAILAISGWLSFVLTAFFILCFSIIQPPHRSCSKMQSLAMVMTLNGLKKANKPTKGSENIRYEYEEEKAELLGKTSEVEDNHDSEKDNHDSEKDGTVISQLKHMGSRLFLSNKEEASDISSNTSNHEMPVTGYEVVNRYEEVLSGDSNIPAVEVDQQAADDEAVIYPFNTNTRVVSAIRVIRNSLNFNEDSDNIGKNRSGGNYSNFFGLDNTDELDNTSVDESLAKSGYGKGVR